MWYVMASIKSLLFISVLFLQLSLFAFTFNYNKPQIVSEYETVIESGDNFTVLCQGNTPLKWKWPEVQDAVEANWTIITTTPVLPKSNHYQYASRLIIQNATYVYTGFYKCFDTNVDPADEDVVSKIYLYVRDENHLSVNNMEVDTVLATQHSEAVLPCRPTSPDVNVQLTLINGEKIDNYTYDPKTGFRFYVDNVSYEDMYCCSYSYADLETDSCIYLKVTPMIQFVPKPILEEISGGHTVVGDKLILECKVKTLTYYISMTWITPTGPPDLNRMSLSSQTKSPIDNFLISQRLTIEKATLKDKGVYSCNVSDNQNHHSINSINVAVYSPNEHFINLTEDNDVYSISEKAGAPQVLWRINVKGHPQPKLFWLNNKNETILEKTDKYQISFTSSEAVLTIKDIAITDYGNYTLVAQNDFETKSLMLFLNVTDKPSVHIESDTFHMVNQKGQVICKVASYPAATVSWAFKPCLDDSCNFEEINETSSFTRGLQLNSFVSVNSANSGYIKCTAKNSIGEDEATEIYLVTDVKNGFDIFGFDESVNINQIKNTVEIAVGENFKMICGASLFNNSLNMVWIRDNQKIKFNERYRIDESVTPYTKRITLNLDNIDFSDAGVYSCQVKTLNGSLKFKNMSVIVSKPSKPEIVNTNMDKDLQIRLPNDVQFYCIVNGVPKPSINWFKNNELIYPSNKTHFSNYSQRVTFLSLDFKDEGLYKCQASNKIGITSKQINLKFKNKPHSDNTILYIIIGVLTILALVFLLIMLIRMRKEKKLQQKLKIAGLANFDKGQVESLNPDLSIDDQAELLPYDKKWEFPIEKLKLGKQLGSGAFGVVMKGVAKGIIEGEESTVVAVKMVKKNAANTYIRALASELKIMVHLGKHLNVVNLLGACTKNVVKKELLVIVEYCRYGNLQNYLLRHRDIFIDQVDPKTGRIDYTIGQDILERTYSVSSNRSNSQSPSMKYAALSFSNNRGNPTCHMVDYRGDNYNGATTARTDITTVSMSPNSGDNDLPLSTSNSVQPEWRSNYRGDYKGNIKPICTKDLLAWAFQVSRGMEYLASRKVLHGDLAARNILLADNNVVKICDFGLAKSMYKSDNYKKKGDGPLPVKWMAIESIRDKIFSTQSDVWSFGIVLWEFFSLAKTPYPGMEADERLYSKLLDGYRMESPEYAPKEIYKMMLDCWHVKPLSRPTFTRLSERIGSLLEDTVRKHYIDLNDPYLVMNTQRLEEGQSDYLAMLSPPNFENLSSPHHYVNDLSPSENTPGYLCMNSAHIFSPRVEDDTVFKFDYVSRTKSEEGTRNELAPMLRINSESECESSNNSPLPVDSFANPTYHLPPKIENLQNKSDKDIVKSSDNYVNMPQNKSVLKDSNPFLSKMDKNIKDYVNSNTRDWENVKI